MQPAWTLLTCSVRARSRTIYFAAPDNLTRGAQTAVENCEALEIHNIMSLSYMCSRCCARTALRNSLKPSPSVAAIAALRQHNNPPTQQQRRWESTASLNPKISGIVDQISQLTLLETADLVSSLKVFCTSSHCKSPPS